MTTKPWKGKVRPQRAKHRHLCSAAPLTPALVAVAREHQGGGGWGVGGPRGGGGSWEASAGLTRSENRQNLSCDALIQPVTHHATGAPLISDHK